MSCSSEGPVEEKDIILRAQTYKYLSVSGHWVGLYIASCETHYFFWGSYIKNT